MNKKLQEGIRILERPKWGMNQNWLGTTVIQGHILDFILALVLRFYE